MSTVLAQIRTESLPDHKANAGRSLLYSVELFEVVGRLTSLPMIVCQVA